ncbi:4-hydroxythreonine-4-phosphate dehydrogenase [Thermaurantimonas aggregans]|uniref:4-hydroxythreonine-4-phosphate dehydrogenase n=1 Tax=Thermaurantimonas aggregans TaxID=2173829 RepID=A0A401XKF5_9FLAO|nr:4-hydroxythreonine-4-phosphate dehydrogenase PdxA [Thermaurantimonas aggregans]MCX8149351.1 4-hydroxythreonine-4-phosphate dehydrogenase PdxA [Thermaurantimonas aggregans]GCD77499.1 4-hydroxythreonine-4-phosphate dehydrogenase [Thermaurantimonas aggregans]
MNTPNKPIIGITCGDLNGIGLEVIIKTMLDNRVTEICTPVLFASSKVVSYHRKALNILDFSFNIINDLSQINHKRPNLINAWKEEVTLEFGKADPNVGKFAVKSLMAAVQALKAGAIDAVVTAPINKHVTQSDEFRFPGHTEFFEHHFGGKSTMILCSDTMRITPLTIHVPLSEVSSLVTEERLLSAIAQFERSLKVDFGIRRPKIAVLGLNPHAGDTGLIGLEEVTVITPAIEKAFSAGILVYGPFSADGFFGSGAFKKFDGIISMYHDQGLIPFKLLAFDEGVNYTAGLPIVRTSPDHGPAYDIAGKGIADETSIKQAIWLAIDILRNRELHAEISANPLPFSQQRSGPDEDVVVDLQNGN